MNARGVKQMNVETSLRAAGESGICSPMPTACRKCGAELPEGAGRCPVCLALVKPPGFFQRLFGGFKLNLSVNARPGLTTNPGLHVKTTVHQSRNFQIRDSTTGETKVYYSLEDVPEKYRAQFSEAMAQEHVYKSEQITIVGPDGVRQTYQSMDEVPPEIRQLIARVEKTPDVG